MATTMSRVGSFCGGAAVVGLAWHVSTFPTWLERLTWEVFVAWVVWTF